MRIHQFLWNCFSWESMDQPVEDDFNPDLTFIFGERISLDSKRYINTFKNKFPKCNTIICSTSGSILGDNIYDKSIIATSIQFDEAYNKVQIFETLNKSALDVGREIGNSFRHHVKDLKLIMVFSDGQTVNGSDLVIGINEIIKGKVPVTGGLAGDSDRFEKTLVGFNERPKQNIVVAVGLYGKNLKIGHGSRDGWDAFGPERIITKSNKNVLLELDNSNALDLYKKHLGIRASELPASAFLFPLHLTLPGSNKKVIRTILSIDETNNTMTFAGNLPEGSKVQLMKANLDKLIDGAIDAAHDSLKDFKEPELAIAISCVGRKLVLGQKVDEEVEETKSAFGSSTKMTGFYSYGEISPIINSNNCQLHNQTMTITTICEK